jgi:hypothetical protein
MLTEKEIVKTMGYISKALLRVTAAMRTDFPESGPEDFLSCLLTVAERIAQVHLKEGEEAGEDAEELARYSGLIAVLAHFNGFSYRACDQCGDIFFVPIEEIDPEAVVILLVCSRCVKKGARSAV